MDKPTFDGLSTKEMLEDIGTKQGRAAKHQDWSTVNFHNAAKRHWLRLAKEEGLDGYAIHQEAYRQASGFYDNVPMYNR